MLGPDLRTEVDVLEHEGAQREHGLSDLGALLDRPGSFGGLDEIVDEPIDPLRAGPTETLDLGAWKVGLTEDPVANCVVDVMVDVRDAVDETHDLAFERLGLLGRLCA